MTDEEKAKEWVRTNSGYSTKEYHGQKAIEAFLAGLEAGKDTAETDLATVAYMQGAESGYNKANEWHFVKDELPDEGTYLVVWQNDKGYKEIFILNYEEDDEEELHWVDDDYEVQDEYVIAWKEIVFPKEIKENEN